MSLRLILLLFVLPTPTSAIKSKIDRMSALNISMYLFVDIVIALFITYYSLEGLYQNAISVIKALAVTISGRRYS
jgi:hypothetical protein